MRRGWRRARSWFIGATPRREHRMMPPVIMVALLAGAAAIACTQTDQNETPRRNGSAPADTVSTGPDAVSGAARDTSDERDEVAPLMIHFSRGESTVEVRRAAPEGATLEAALHQLLRGPTEGERATGIHSWFSDTTAGALRSVAVDNAGRAIVDFADLRELIPNASTSAGSGMLLRELNATVFEFPEVQSVEYRMEGSCAEFFEWLQYQCETVTRP